MKKYKLRIKDKTYVLSGLTDGVKQNITDVVKAREMVTIQRLLKKGLLNGDVYLSQKQAVFGITFMSEPVISFMSSPIGVACFLREMAEEGGTQVDDDDVEAIAEDVGEEGSEAWATLKTIFEDSVPKAKPGPALSTAPEEPTNCEPSSATSPSASPTTKSES